MKWKQTDLERSGTPIGEPLFVLPGVRGDIFATADVLDSGIVGLGEQFRQDAAIYDKRYFNVEAKISTISRALSIAGKHPKKDGVALDIGCGSGNATFAILQMFEEIRLYSTDLSPEMLSILLHKADSIAASDRITAFVSDASKLALNSESIDLVTGSSMVHHLINPDGFLEKILRSIARDGVAIFFEPFQAGHIVIRTLLLSLAAIAESRSGFSAEQIHFFRDYAHTIDVMVRPDRADELIQLLDDKWMFCKKQFEDVGARSGCRVKIFATNPPIGAFEDKISNVVYAGLGQILVWPDWALDLVRTIDLSVGAHLREELLMEGCVVFTKE
jgi:ubiquinone/menaquinone biosynthesis C-methylase UbiE